MTFVYFSDPGRRGQVRVSHRRLAAVVGGVAAVGLWGVFSAVIVGRLMMREDGRQQLASVLGIGQSVSADGPALASDPQAVLAPDFPVVLHRPEAAQSPAVPVATPVLEAGPAEVAPAETPSAEVATAEAGQSDSIVVAEPATGPAAEGGAPAVALAESAAMPTPPAEQVAVVETAPTEVTLPVAVASSAATVADTGTAAPIMESPPSPEPVQALTAAPAVDPRPEGAATPPVTSEAGRIAVTPPQRAADVVRLAPKFTLNESGHLMVGLELANKRPGKPISGRICMVATWVEANGAQQLRTDPDQLILLPEGGLLECDRGQTFAMATMTRKVLTVAPPADTTGGGQFSGATFFVYVDGIERPLRAGWPLHLNDGPAVSRLAPVEAGPDANPR